MMPLLQKMAVMPTKNEMAIPQIDSGDLELIKKLMGNKTSIPDVSPPREVDVITPTDLKPRDMETITPTSLRPREIETLPMTSPAPAIIGGGRSPEIQALMDEMNKGKRGSVPAMSEGGGKGVAKGGEITKLSPQEYVKNKVGDFEGELVLGRGLGTIEINTIKLDKTGTGQGTKIIDALKEYAGQKGERIVVPKPYNKVFWDKQGFVDQQDGSMKFDPQLSPSKGGEKGLTDKVSKRK